MPGNGFPSKVLGRDWSLSVRTGKDQGSLTRAQLRQWRQMASSHCLVSPGKSF